MQNTCIILCFGNTIDGQLGLGGIEEEQVFSPRKLQYLPGKNIKDISSSFNHSLILSEEGVVYGCGNNDYSQLGHDKSRKKPECVDVLETKTIATVKCGLKHSVALTNQGQIYTWGSNENGQLGRSVSEIISVPKMAKLFSSMVVVQIACGYNHTMALTDVGSVYTFGTNEEGQLGVAGLKPQHPYTDPKLVTQLIGLPIAQIASGAHHCFVMTVSGALFGWGLNKYGQLGVGDQRNRPTPELCRTLRSQEPVYVACGDNHTAVLTKTGGVFTFGAGMYGQLGHGNLNSESNPKKIFEFMGFEVSMVACGRNHTIAYVKSKSKVYTFGLGSNGQLGVESRSNFSIPMIVKGLVLKDNSFVRSIHAGGDQSFIIISNSQTTYPQVDMRQLVASQQIRSISSEFVKKITKCSKLDEELEKDIRKTFASLSCWNASFLNKEKLHQACDKRNHGVDVVQSRQLFESIYNSKCKTVRDVVDSTLETTLLPNLFGSYLDVEAIRWLVAITTTYYFVKSSDYLTTVIYPIIRTMTEVDIHFSGIVEGWWHSCGVDYQKNLIQLLKNIVLSILGEKRKLSQFEIIQSRQLLYGCMELLKKLHNVNELNKKPLDYTLFYIDDLSEFTNLELDYVIWSLKLKDLIFDLSKAPANYEQETVPYCAYPFIFNGQCKSLLLHTDAKLQMSGAVNEVQRQNLMSLFLPIDPENPTLDVMVTRDNIVRDTLSQLSKHEDRNFKKPLKVIFLGEDALDAGGVKKEFFLLLLKDLLDPKYGMFQYFEESRLIWFNSDTFEASDMYRLIGVVCGLAIYNNNIISMNLPLVLFKKILNKQATLDDLKELQPTVGRSMQSLLDYNENDVADIFSLTFEITKEFYGELVTVPLVDNGSDKQVTKDNKSEYVNKYVDYIFNKSVIDQFNAFSSGFLKVCGGKILELFQPLELQAMVIGNENYDWDELEANTIYKDYNKNDTTIKLFWEVFKELTLEEKKRFLLYLTGCDRIPIHGMKAMKLVIQPMGTSEDLLPVAHTCFNVLDLPRYTTKENLKRKLLQAIEHTQGFGLA